jgi:hypothetical protein
MIAAMNEKFQRPGDIDIGKQMLAESSGIERADLLSIMHIEMAMDSLQKVKGRDGKFVLDSSNEDEFLRALVKLAVLVKTRKH